MFLLLIFVFTVSSLIFSRVDAENFANSPRDQESNYCLLPPYPEHGRYTFSNYPSATPGERYPSVKLDISCDPGYKNENAIKSVFCFNGEWSALMPTCVRDMQGSCTLPTDDLRVEYRCHSFLGTPESSQECKSFVPSGTVVTPVCRSPAYFSLSVLSKMHCRDGKWDYSPICKPACGLTTQHRQLEGTSSNHLELPWHAVVYRKLSNPYQEVCGGSLITANKIISGAVCFFYPSPTVEQLPAGDFVVTVNKMYRLYTDPRDRNSQRSDVLDIKIPSNYGGYEGNYENNIAIMIVKTPFVFHLSVRPVCLDFDNNLDRTQLTEGNSGKTVRWNDAGNNDQSSQVLNVVDFSYINNEDCKNIVLTESSKYFTKDKFCTRHNNGPVLDAVNLGSGLAFLESTTGRYYLHGVLSFAYMDPNDKTRIIAYTSIIKHERFIKQYL